jgi:tetrahydromethanopterin S-methyltransferase subunit E
LLFHDLLYGTKIKISRLLNDQFNKIIWRKKIMDPVTLGVVALMGAVATIGGAAEDLESDIGSQSNPNSQVQLAPQMGHLHRMINKAASGEPVAYGVWCGVAGAIAYIVMSLGMMPLVAIAMGACVAAFVHAIYTVTSHMGRIVGQSQFEQPLFMDVLTQSLGPIAAHGFIASFGIVGMAYLMTLPLDGLGHPFPLPLLAVLWGITIGAIGSSTGDVHYGAESEYQKFDYGGGTPVAIQGDIVTKAPLGAKNSMDVVNFCAKFGGPLTGFCFGLVVFFSFWNTVVFGVYGGIIVGIIIVILLIIMDNYLEVFARNKYGPYEEE